MAKLTKKQQLYAKSYDFSKNYSLDEGIELVKKTGEVKFDGSVDIAINLGIDTKNPLQMIRGGVVLPHGTGKVAKVLVICSADKEEEAKKAGADYVGLDDYLKKIEEGWTGFDVMVTMPSLMAKVGRLGRVLGPSGLMPNIKTGTVTTEVGKGVEEIKKGKVSIRTDKGGVVHSRLGRVSFSVEKLKENVQEMVAFVMKAKHSTVKGTFLQKVTLSSTMGPGVNIALNSFIS
jgi:large subunit ribosomal protein L1